MSQNQSAISRAGNGLLPELLSALRSNPDMAQRAIHELLAADPVEFFASTLEVLKTGACMEGVAYLAGVLEENDLLVETITNPTLLSLENAVAMARSFRWFDNKLDVKLMAGIESEQRGPVTASGRLQVLRVLSIIDAISDCSALLAGLTRLQSNSDPMIRSKATLLMVRANRNATWFQQRLHDRDPRVRANAIEGLLAATPTPGELDLLRAAAADPHHRVATTALLVLSKNGDEGAALKLIEFSQHHDEMFRAGASWAMGQSGLARFLPALRQMTEFDHGHALQMARNATIALQRDPVRA